ncbi:hypothetical protein BJX99DRAFT_90593 [Aspergillus californicus]
MSQNSNNSDSTTRIRRPRVERGRRSRNGCSTCISKKVKCDEVRPHCTRCIRLHLACEWPLPKPSVAFRRRGFGPIKDRDSGLWSPSSIMPKSDDDAQLSQLIPSTPTFQDCLPSPRLEELFQQEGFLKEHPNHDGYFPFGEELLLASPQGISRQWQCSAVASSSTELPFPMAQISSNEESLDDTPRAFELLRAPIMQPLLTATDISFAYAAGTTPALGSDDKQAASFHCKVFAPMKSTRSWTCSAHTLFLNKAYNRGMALHFLLAVSHSELAIYYGQGPQPPQESREHFEQGSQLFLQAQNPFVSPNHVSMMLSFLYMYMFWMRRDHLDPMKLRDLSRAVLAYVRTYGLDTLCASDDVLSYGGSACDGTITVSEQVLLARIITYLYDRDGFCCFFGCGGYFANHLNSDSQRRQRIWLRSRATFMLTSSDLGVANGIGTEIEDAATLDAYFELIILHQEINDYSQMSATQSMAVKSRLQQRLDAVHTDHASLFRQVANSHCYDQSNLMAYVTVSFFYALYIYFYRARLSSFGSRPVSSAFQDALSSLVSTAYHTIKTGPVQLLERFQWSLFMAGLETTDPVHQEWIGNNISDPAIKEGFEHIQAVKRQSPGDITMQQIRFLIEEGLSVSSSHRQST